MAIRHQRKIRSASRKTAGATSCVVLLLRQLASHPSSGASKQTTKQNMAGTSSVAGEVFVDALPYFDQGYDAAGVREAVSICFIHTCCKLASIRHELAEKRATPFS